MSPSDVIAGAQNAASAAQGMMKAVSGLADLFGAPGGSGSFQSQVRISTWRKVPFVTLAAESKFGRRKAVHEYPFRDLPWVEDMGRARRKFSVTGFIIGDDAINQRNRLVHACEAPGPGELVHGTFGAITVDLVDVSFSEKWDTQRYFEVTMSFVQGGQRIYPAAAQSTGAVVAAAATAAHAAAAQSFAAKSLSALKSGAAVVASAVATASALIKTVAALVRDATTVFNAVSAVANTAKAFFGGRVSGLAGIMSAVQGTSNAIQRGVTAVGGVTQSTGSLAALATVSRDSVTQASANLAATTETLGL